MDNNRQSQTTLLLRLLGGGYLLYLGISILSDGTASLPVTAGAVVFIAVGAGLLVMTLPKVLRRGSGPEDPGSGEK